MERYLMYLRKSRMDTDYENVSVAETLSRHRKILEDFCKLKRLHVVEVLEEVVSGESMHARPEMMRLLDLISTGMYAGVVCMDIERLSRGSSMDSGYIMQVLQVNNCKIITPGKTYDLRNDSDEQFTDMKFMFSRYELKSINTRLERGRNQSASEGKFMGSMAPYGYRPFNLAGEKGNSLRIEPEEAKVVQMIFEMYGQQGMGYNAIAYKLNDLHIPARKGEWSQTSVVNILNNEVYLGKIRWRREPVKRVIKDGKITKKRIQNQNYDLYEGRHDPIITQEQWDCVKAAQAKKNHNPVNTDRQLKNPFAGILVCGKCGAIMKRTVPDKKRNPTPWYRCSSRGCDCKIIKCTTVENAIYEAMDEWLEEYTIHLASDEQTQEDPVAMALEAVRAQLAGLQLQQENICEYLEKGVYTIDMFTKRNSALTQEIKQLQISEAELLRQQTEGNQKDQLTSQIVPVTQQILESYSILTPLEKNQLWKLVMKKATVYRSQDDELTVRVYPNLPK
jgi:DNA invertase Pin-like site-specific DNA recombinase